MRWRASRGSFRACRPCRPLLWRAGSRATRNQGTRFQYRDTGNAASRSCLGLARLGSARARCLARRPPQRAFPGESGRRPPSTRGRGSRCWLRDRLVAGHHACSYSVRAFRAARSKCSRSSFILRRISFCGGTFCPFVCAKTCAWGWNCGCGCGCGSARQPCFCPPAG